jgi:hypothetical protein
MTLMVSSCVGFEVLRAIIMKSGVFWDKTLGFCLLFAGFYASTLKMEAVHSSETSVYSWLNTRYIPEGSTLRLITNSKF